MKWIIDDAGDLVNLEYIAVIALNPLSAEQADEFLTGSTNEVLAIDIDGNSYRLAHGTELACKTVRESIKGQLSNPDMLLVQPPEVVR